MSTPARRIAVVMMLEVDGTVMARQLVGIVPAAVGNRLHQVFVFAQGT